jgi:hypothetical protein
MKVSEFGFLLFSRGRKTVMAEPEELENYVKGVNCRYERNRKEDV